MVFRLFHKPIQLLGWTEHEGRLSSTHGLVPGTSSNQSALRLEDVVTRDVS